MKRIKIAKIILRVWAIHFVICLFFNGFDFFTEPQTVQAEHQSLMSHILLIIGVGIYISPLYDLYNNAVKRMSAEKRMYKNGQFMGMGFMDAKDAPAGLQKIIDKAERKQAETGDCDCDRCTEIRANIAKEKETAAKN
jgi:hypothetical protein